MTTVEVRSSGWGPRETLWAKTRHHNLAVSFMTSFRFDICKAWPRDGVAIIIRRES